MSGLRLEVGSFSARIRERFETLRAEGFHTKLVACDETLWGEDSLRRRVVANRLGWMTVPAAMRDRAPEFTAFADQVAKAGFTRVLLLGMGGSSLAPETLSRIFGTRPGGLPLTIDRKSVV